MDRRALGVLIAGLALAAAAPPEFTALRWLAPGADRVAALSRRPAECMILPADAATRRKVEIGRAAFRTPLLLGGQAARAGLSCAACHRSGRGNPEFHFAGISGAAGTADVTASLFSSHRGDGIANPRPIPDLAGDIDRRSARLRPFIAGLIEQEFDGPPPPRAVLDGVVAYVAALGGACSAGDEAESLADDLDAVTRAVAAATNADTATTALMLAAARTELGQIDQRFAGSPRMQAVVRRAAVQLGTVRLAGLSGAPDAGRKLAVWRTRWTRDAAILQAAAGTALYDPVSLATALR